MRNLFTGTQGCAPGATASGNPLTRFLDAVTQDPLRARQLQEGYGRQVDGKGGEVVNFNDLRDSRHVPPQGPSLSEAAAAASMERAWQSQPRAVPSPGPGPAVQTQGPGMTWTSEFASSSSSSAGPQAHEALVSEFSSMHMQQQQQQARPSASQPVQQQPLQNQQGPFFQGASYWPPPSMGMSRPGPQGSGFLSMMPPPVQQSAPAPLQPVRLVEQGPQEEQEQAESGGAMDREKAKELVEKLKASGDPKIARSEFVAFVDRVAKGELEFKDNQVVDKEGRVVNWDGMYGDGGIEEEDEMEEVDDIDSMEEVLRKMAEEHGGDLLDDMEDTEKLREAMASAWGPADRSKFDELWKEFEEKGAIEERGETGGQYAFSEKSKKYVEQEEDCLAVALRLLAEGRDEEARHALEAEVQKHPDSSEGWRLLGQLHAANDEDIDAIICLQKGHEVDPYNLEALLALGVSLTNELDASQALQHLRTWVQNHEVFSELPGASGEAPQELDALKEHVCELFENAVRMRPDDPDARVALGVVHHIRRSFAAATAHLMEAARLRPTDFTIWNKLGATLANAGLTKAALPAYNMALEMKPNYTRVWSNLAIANANMDNFPEAARLYVSALRLNPRAQHVWHYLHSVLLTMQRFDTLPLVDAADLEGLSKAFPAAVDPKTLPRPMTADPMRVESVLREISTLERQEGPNTSVPGP
uniref:Uncharacterized protein n=1 Tax=Chromera velia CCMP2878 TaxID=1169474 RepID=A0A0G4FBR0_9ALVE|eukprot:Cvel_16168.t1-p1 / transcript=Cvel_16168.t1 / gene=Cvel_16168 / organism=Chromera_velia_CCMP2878 / gene_product=Peroxisome biogenesis protein 5, putative / transcript_product=Peroxisome biogenesis protein 5, putative / location=Cvel_scaffold1232:36717-39520(+) / protein_length=701 / sequence_SO=supercontig / SO=protein_coding / is_pseudo=false